MKRKPHVLIAGAGIGGLSAALGLLRCGFDVSLFEQASELKEIGAGIQVASNGTGALFWLGLEEQVRHWGVEAVDKVVRLWNTGQCWSIFSQTGSATKQQFAYPLLMLHRADVHTMLLQAVLAIKPDAVRLNCRAIDFEQRTGSVNLVLSDGTHVIGDLLIGADGLHSCVRQRLFGAAVPRFSGTICWRGMAPTSQLSVELRRPVATNWLGPTAHVTNYPVKRGELLNFAGQVDTDNWTVESWVEEGSRDDCLADFPGWHPDVIDTIQKIDKFYKWAIFIRDPLAAWTAGRVTLMGDACHAMIPYLGQGANMAIEDGVVLARCLHAWPDDIDHALRRYEAARIERTTRVVLGSTSMVGTNHHPALADPVEGVKYIESQWDPSKSRARYDWIFEYDAGTVAL